MKIRRIHAAGMTLIEVAVGLVIFAMLVSSMLVPLQNQVETRKIDETQRMLAQARDAILGYVASNGYFPCPADSATNGLEAVGANAHDAQTGSCAASVGTTAGYYGFLPAATLGISPVDAQSYAVDAWATTGNRIRYAVYTDGATLGVSLVRSGGMAAVGIPALGGLTLFNVCLSGSGVSASDCGSPLPAGQQIVATNAVAVIWSVGANPGARSVHETQNQNSTRIFISRPRSDVAGSEFDDVVTWIPMTTVISRMIAARQLP